MAYTFTEAELADESYDGIERRGRCTCHDVQQWSGGHFGSVASLGVSCGSCQDLDRDYGYVSDWNDLTREERITFLTEVRDFQERKAREAAERGPFDGDEGFDPPF